MSCRLRLQARIAGAVARPVAIGDAQASVSGQVRVLLPERRISPDFSSAMLGLYGKNREQRLPAFIAFKRPGTNSSDCENGFIAHKSIRRAGNQPT
jgi:hypothetical protein